MKYLLDTHALLWYLFASENLSKAAKEIINNEVCYYSKVSLWEIAIKQTCNLLQYKNSIQDIIDACKEEEFAELLVSGKSLELIKNLPDIHRDLFDRLLITMAQENKSNTRFNLTFVLSRKLLGRSPAAPFFMQLSRQLCLAIRFGKAANAGQADVRLRTLGVNF